MISRLPEGGVDGIRDHTLRLCEALTSRGVSVDVVTRQRDLWRVAWPYPAANIVDPRSASDHVVLIQYNPFMYGRRGVAPYLVLDAWRLRHSGHRVVLMVHEPWLLVRGWRPMLMRLWQRGQLWALRAASDCLLASTQPWAEQFARWHPHRSTTHLPVGSNLPDMRACRAEARARLSAGGEDLVIATFGTDHPSHLAEHVKHAVRVIAERNPGRVILLELGMRNRRFDAGELAGMEVMSPGAQPATELAANLSAADVFLAALMDGASTRRTTLMAALQHGVPVVATAGPSTDRLLREAGDAVTLVPVDDPIGFAEAAADLCAHPERIHARGAAARALYEREFDWPVVVDRLLHAIAATGETSVGGRMNSSS